MSRFTERRNSKAGMYGSWLRCVAIWVFVVLWYDANAEDLLPGGVTGTVYCGSDSSWKEWTALPHALVVVRWAETDSLGEDQSIATVTLTESGMIPRFQVIAPGDPLRIISRRSKVARIIARAENGQRLFNIALPLPGLEVEKVLQSSGIVRLYDLELSPERELAYIVVLPNAGWALADSAGSFLIPGIPPGCREIWCFEPSLGSAVDSVCIEPARATQVRLYLPRIRRGLNN